MPYAPSSTCATPRVFLFLIAHVAFCAGRVALRSCPACLPLRRRTKVGGLFFHWTGSSTERAPLLCAAVPLSPFAFADPPFNVRVVQASGTRNPRDAHERHNASGNACDVMNDSDAGCHTAVSPWLFLASSFSVPFQKRAPMLHAERRVVSKREWRGESGCVRGRSGGGGRGWGGWGGGGLGARSRAEEGGAGHETTA